MTLKRVFLSCILAILFSIVYPFIFTSEHVYAVNDTTNTWSTTTNLPNTIASSVVASVNSKIYFFGGANTTDFSQIFIPATDSNGQILNWNNANNNLPQTLFWSSLVQKNNRVYVLGGASLNTPGVYVNNVYSSVIQPDGTIGSWETLASLPQSSAMGAAAVVGDRIYFAGGFNPVYSKKIYSAPINPNGSLGAWIDAGDLPAPQIGFSMIEYNGHLIIIGGDGSSSVYKTTPDANGLISGWDATSSLPTPVYRGSVIKVGSNLIEIGGQDSLFTTDKVYYTSINNDGTLDPWTLSSNHLPSPVHAASAAIVGEYAYLMGGYNNISGSYLNSVYFTKLNLAPPEITLNVPLLKQTDPSWGNLLYDTANLWAPLNNQGISNWGCALTSAAMVFQYHKIVTLPDNSTLTPATLNTWLKQQSDGYIENGFINWLALSRLSKIAKLKNPLFSFDALEYERVGGTAIQQLKTDLQNNIPDILEEVGHYIVGKGTFGATFAINDPFYTRTLLSEYSNTFLSLGRFVPSNTDLSYIMLVANKDVDMSFKTASGSALGYTFIQKPLVDDVSNSPSGSELRIAYIPKPETDTYTATLSSLLTGLYKLKVYYYDKDGNVKIDSQTGVINPQNDRTVKLVFNKTSLSGTSSDEQVTFKKLKDDLILLNSLKYILRKEVFNNLKGKIDAASKAYPKNKKTSKKELAGFMDLLTKHRGKLVSEDAYQILTREATSLTNSL